MLSGSLPAIGLPAPFSITILPKPLQPIPNAIPMRTLVFFLFRTLAALPLAALTGALILSGASVFAKLISPGAVVPVGIITAVAGVPMLFAIIARRGNEG